MHWQVLLGLTITILNFLVVYYNQIEFGVAIGRWLFAILAIFTYLFGIGLGMLYALV